MMYSNYDKHLSQSNRKIYCDLNGNELEKYANICANIDQLQKQLFTGNRMTVLQILENSQERNCGRVLFQYSYWACNFIKSGSHHGCFCGNFPKFSEQVFFM